MKKRKLWTALVIVLWLGVAGFYVFWDRQQTSWKQEAERQLIADPVYRQAVRWLDEPGWELDGDLLRKHTYFVGVDGDELLAYNEDGHWPVLCGLTPDQRHLFAQYVRDKIKQLRH